MNVATCLGVDTVERPAMRWARQHWREWGAIEPSLAVVSDVLDLPQWMRPASPSACDEVLGALARMTATDVNAISVMTWLLVPGAVAVARQLADLSPDIDAHVARELWLAVQAYDGRPGRRVAATLLVRARREVMADLGVGDAAWRRDRAWACAIPMGSVPEGPAAAGGVEVDPERELADFLDVACERGALSRVQRQLLLDVAWEAARMGVPAKRGRGGLTTPSVAQMVADQQDASARTVRRRAATALADLQEFARSVQ